MLECPVGARSAVILQIKVSSSSRHAKHSRDSVGSLRLHVPVNKAGVRYGHPVS